MTTPLTLEQRILIAADFNTDRIEGIRELMREESVSFAEWILDNSYTKSDKGWYRYYIKREDFPAGFSMSSPVYEFSTIEQIYELYLLQSNKQVNL